MGCCNGTLTGQGGCGCNTCVPCVQAGCVPNCTSIYNKSFDATVTFTSNWNIPQCDQYAYVYVSDASRILLDSIFWNPTYGYFKVISISLTTNRLEIQNLCIGDDIPAAGTQVPACTPFVISQSPYAPSSILDIYLTSDFTAPEVGECVAITVTATNGLVVGQTIQIGSYTYSISTVSDETNIVICNTGAGYPGGTPITAQDSFGRYIYQIIVLAVSLSNILTASNPTAQTLSVGVPLEVSIAPVTFAPVPESTPFLYKAVLIGNIQLEYEDKPVVGMVLTADGLTIPGNPIEENQSLLCPLTTGNLQRSLKQDFTVLLNGFTSQSFTPKLSLEHVSGSGQVEVLAGGVSLTLAYIGVPQ